MKLISKALKLIVPLLVLSACVDSSDDFSPTDPNTTFSLFPSAYFVFGYSETYNLSGFDNNGDLQAGLLSVEIQSQSIFNTEPAIPVIKVLDLAGNQSGLFPTATKTEYFSTDSSDRRQVGFLNTLSGNTLPFVAVSATAIPETAKIGEFGEIGTYIDGFGIENIKTWQLEDGGDGRARLVFISTTRDSFGLRLSRNEEEYLIEQNGDRVATSLRFFSADLIQTLTLSGDKI